MKLITFLNLFIILNFIALPAYNMSLCCIPNSGNENCHKSQTEASCCSTSDENNKSECQCFKIKKGSPNISESINSGSLIKKQIEINNFESTELIIKYSSFCNTNIKRNQVRLLPFHIYSNNTTQLIC